MMDTLYMTEKLSDLDKEKISKYKKFKRMEAFQKALSEYRDTIGEWEITNFKDAGPNWRQSSNLNCDCGRLLRYQYTVTNKTTLKIHRFGITHLKAETGFSDQTVNAINRNLNNVEREIEEVEHRLVDNWTFNVKIPKSIVLPSELQRLFDEDIPLSSEDESWLVDLIRQAQQKEWEKKRLENQKNRISDLQHSEKTESPHYQRSGQRKNSFELQDNEKDFINLLLQNGMGSADAIAEELHKHIKYQERYITGRSKLYPLCVFYLEELVDESKVNLVQNLGTIDRLYETC